MGLILAGAVSAAPTPGFERYKVILDRQPFGLVLSAATNAEPAAPPPIVAGPGGEALGMRASSLVMVDGEGPRVGLVDVKTGRSLYLMPGETQEGIRVVSADFDAEEVIIQRGAEMAILKLKEAGTTEKRMLGALTAPRPGTDPRRILGGVAPTTPPAPAPTTPSAPPAAPRLQGAELEAHLRNYQMEVIRKGLPPLPIPLTPEMDAQLVQEGVLPPQGTTVIQGSGAQIIIQHQPQPAP